MDIGVEVIQRETFGSALDLGASALKLLGFRNYQAYRAALTFKHHDEKTLIELHKLFGDDEAFLVQTRLKNQDLIELLSSDEEEKDETLDHSWERPGPL